MNAETNESFIHEYRRLTRRQRIGFILISIPLVTIAYVGLIYSHQNLPNSFGSFLPGGPYRHIANWVGQNESTVLRMKWISLITLYLMKWPLTRWIQGKWIADWFYFWIMVSSLPLIWFFLCLDWKNPHVFPVASWIGDPIGMWTIPTLTFLSDRLGTPPTLRFYCLRSCLEILLSPAWLFIWVWIQFLYFGWVTI